MRHPFLRTLIFGAGLLCLLPTVKAQDLDEVLFTVGTTLEDADNDGQAWNYLLWQAEDLQMLQHRTIAVYSKSGNPDSADPYVYEGTARTRLDPAAIQTLINRGEQLGDDPAKLESDINNLFEELVPDGNIPLREKISAVVEGCLLDPERFENLIFLSRTHPTLSLVLGTGFASKQAVGDIRTWELRECPPAYGEPEDCQSVIARITLKVGQPDLLPAPGRPVYVPFSDDSGNPDPRAHLNVPLRWETPAALRERLLLQFGYNVYRMAEADVLANNFDADPPPPQLLADLAADPGHSTTRANGAPVLIDQLLSEAEALDTVADPRTFFFIDDNNRYDPGGVPFENGDRYYYFLTARDVLGRDGLVSDGTLVQICDFQPPPQPKRVRVSNHYTFDTSTSTNTQHFKVEWVAPDLSDAQTPETITEYHVYRWWSIEEMHQADAFPFVFATDTSGGLVAVLSASEREFIDDGADAPYLSVQRFNDGTTSVDQGYANKTFWYTVRAVDGSACGGNLSGNSAPGYGVLRDRIGPPATNGTLEISCYDIRVVAPQEVQRGEIWESDPDPDTAYLTLEGERKDNRIDWVEFHYRDPSTAEWVLIGDRHYFSTGETNHLLREKVPFPDPANLLEIACRMGGLNGRVSPDNILGVGPSGTDDNAYYLYWMGEVLESRVPPADDCTVHVPVGADGRVNGIDITFPLTDTTEEWKVYRRVNDGRLSLIAQGLDSATITLSKTVSDLNMPAKGSRICYFVQLFDQHGNPSPIVRIGCVDVQGKESLPAPMLSLPVSTGAEMNPQALLAWFSPPYGIERFEVWVTSESGNLPAALGPDFENPEADVVIDGQTWRPFRTGRLPTTFPSNAPEFATQATGIALGEAYTFRVRAIGDKGTLGPFSNQESFSWNPDTSAAVSGPDVPWPALGLPRISSNFNSAVIARTVESGLFDGGAVRIGELDYTNLDVSLSGENPSDFYFPPNILNLEQAVVKNSAGEILFPFVLYRYQVPNTEFPQVSGDVYQVSPMLESIAARLETFQGYGDPAYHNYDPFYFIAQSETRDNRFWFDLLVKDTQPVISGASYRYLIVRFDPVSREIAEVIPTNTIEIP